MNILLWLSSMSPHALPWWDDQLKQWWAGAVSKPLPATNHAFHLVDLSPWPFLSAMGSLMVTTGLVSWMNCGEHWYIFFIGLKVVLGSSWQWWRDVSREATFSGKHTSNVEGGLRMGMILFITSEIFLFLAFFWAFFHSSLSPNIDIGTVWPPAGVNVIKPFEVPLLNTTLLLSSGVTITWAHMALLNSLWIESLHSLGSTVFLGLMFTSLQLMEYQSSSFSMSDSVYGSTFYLATGFHGVHVIIGTLFIIISSLRQMEKHLTCKHHFGFEASAWYWHFVDVVWLFLFISLYWWAS